MRAKAVTPATTATVFTGLALGMALLFWLLVSLAAHGAVPFAMRATFDFNMDGNSIRGVLLWAMLSGFGPALAAILTAACVQGRGGLKELWRTVTRWRAPGWLYALLFLGTLTTSALVAGIAYALHLLQFSPDLVRPVRFAIFFLPMLVFDGPLGEEIGWRGLLLPQLLQLTSPIKASLAVGVIWFLWHIPLYLAAGRDLHLLGFFINVLGISVIFTWFYIRSGFSTFVTILLHATSNFGLFLILKSFTHGDDLSALQAIHSVIIVLIAIAAAISLRGASSRNQT
jgi:uncharacterized protein